MSASRSYFAWTMVAKAIKDEQKNRKRLRRQREDPLENLCDQKFIELYRLSKNAFIYLCELLHEKTELKSTQRVTLESKVLCALTFYAHGGYQRNIGESSHFSQEAISVYIKEVTNALNHLDITNRFIKFPTSPQERGDIKARFHKKYGVPGVIGCIDGCHFKIFTPSKEDEHLYYCKEHYYSLNVQMVCDSECRILAVNPKFGGATHNAFIYENSHVNTFMQKLHREKELVWLLGNAGYPQRPWMMTPYTDPVAGSIQEFYNEKQSTARAVIENTFGRLKNRWRCLYKKTGLHYPPAKCAQIIIACCVLHNLALAYSVPDPEDNNMDTSLQETFERSEIISEDSGNDLLVGISLRDLLARRLTKQIGTP